VISTDADCPDSSIHFMISRIHLQRHYVWLLPILLTAAAIWKPWINDGSPEKNPWRADFTDFKADFVFEDITHTRKSGAVTEWTLRARTGRMYEDENVMELETVAINFSLARDDHMTVSAETGIYRINDSEMFLRDDVRVLMGHNTTLRTSSLVMENDTGLVRTDDEVIIVSDGMEIRGQGLEYDLRVGKLTVSKQETLLSEKGPFRLREDRHEL